METENNNEIEDKEKSYRVKYNNIGKPNKLCRISPSLKSKYDHVNNERKRIGFKCFSFPFFTKLITKHKKFWKPIENDLINYDTELNGIIQEDEFDDK